MKKGGKIVIFSCPKGCGGDFVPSGTMTTEDEDSYSFRLASFHGRCSQCGCEGNIRYDSSDNPENPIIIVHSG